jgi:hypothetical protein
LQVRNSRRTRWRVVGDSVGSPASGVPAPKSSSAQVSGSWRLFERLSAGERVYTCRSLPKGRRICTLPRHPARGARSTTPDGTAAVPRSNGRTIGLGRATHAFRKNARDRPATCIEILVSFASFPCRRNPFLSSMCRYYRVCVIPQRRKVWISGDFRPCRPRMPVIKVWRNGQAPMPSHDSHGASKVC